MSYSFDAVDRGDSYAQDVRVRVDVELLEVCQPAGQTQLRGAREQVGERLAS
ncbi:hypothetical protein GPZ77_00260 [Streptomyces sp. QHH-9511]|uniref:hypothetical protein n=1 Tax=Streptomyces sp. QHH-9511 TaxID=2684468 RepID=UPI0013187AAA|nr:hypothetical protein [Streptomyces sp. QHH-9511]QGZ47065.1 hypothetical protein GPZ77_00260 [Streptomyces sp. QHH-9511]